MVLFKCFSCFTGTCKLTENSNTWHSQKQPWNAHEKSPSVSSQNRQNIHIWKMPKMLTCTESIFWCHCHANFNFGTSDKNIARQALTYVHSNPRICKECDVILILPNIFIHLSMMFVSKRVQIYTTFYFVCINRLISQRLKITAMNRTKWKDGN